MAKIDFLKSDSEVEETYSTQLQTLRSKVNEILLDDVVRADAHFVENVKAATALVKDNGSGDRLAFRVRREIIVASKNDNNLKPLESLAGLYTNSKGLLSGKKFPHVIRAWAGDLKSAWREGYQCNATHQLRQICSKENTACKGADDGKGVLNVAALCGYDPYYAPGDRNRGLVVTYACVSDHEIFRDALNRSPMVDPLSGLEFSKADIKRSTIRHPSQEVTCH